MSFITRNEVKKILGIVETDTTKDDQIDSLLVPSENFVFDYTNNSFEIYPFEYYLEADTISFDAGYRRIHDSASGFIAAGLKSGVPIRIQGDLLNDGVYNTETVSAGVIQLQSDQVIEERAVAADLYVRITMVRIPQNVKLFIARFIEFNFPNDKRSDGIASESFGGYSVSYVSQEDVPANLLAMLAPYRKLS